VSGQPRGLQAPHAIGQVSLRTDCCGENVSVRNGATD